MGEPQYRRTRSNTRILKLLTRVGSANTSKECTSRNSLYRKIVIRLGVPKPKKELQAIDSIGGADFRPRHTPAAIACSMMLMPMYFSLQAQLDVVQQGVSNPAGLCRVEHLQYS